jgi:hypothetical protein
MFYRFFTILIFLGITLGASQPTYKLDEDTVNPSENDESVKQYIPHIEDLGDGIFYFGIVILIFGILFFLLVCFGCGHSSCGINLRGNMDRYEEI